MTFHYQLPFPAKGIVTRMGRDYPRRVAAFKYGGSGSDSA
jgi:hypothetical protein